jgi:tetratricopeptide (TPR) repeat protein
MNRLGIDLIWEGRYAEAEKLQREELASAYRVLGPEHPKLLVYIGNFGLLLKREGRYLEAEEMIRQALEIDRRVLGPDHYNTASDLYNLGCIAALKGNRDEALALIREAVDHGLIPRLHVRNIELDLDLKSLYGDPRFAALVAHARERAAALKAK